MGSEMSRRSVLRVGAAGAAAGLTGAATAMGMEHKDDQMKAMSPVEKGFKDGKYVLPELPYAYDALEPMYDQRTVRIHHDRHHQGYVNGLNSTLGMLEEAQKKGDFSDIKSLSRNLAFHGSGHVLHTLFWNSMTPGGSDVPDKLAKKMKDSFGSVKAGHDHFAAATKAVEASGWGVLAYEPIGNKLVVLQAEKHQDLTIWGVVPLLVCDVWEHAYYLKFANNRGQWVDNFMKIANWEFAAGRLPHHG